MIWVGVSSLSYGQQYHLYIGRIITLVILVGLSPLGNGQDYHPYAMDSSITFMICVGLSPLGYGQEYNFQNMNRRITLGHWQENQLQHIDGNKTFIGVSPLGYRWEYHLQVQLIDRCITFMISIEVSLLGQGLEYYLQDIYRSINFRIWIAVSP